MQRTPIEELAYAIIVELMRKPHDDEWTYDATPIFGWVESLPLEWNHATSRLQIVETGNRVIACIPGFDESDYLTLELNESEKLIYQSFKRRVYEHLHQKKAQHFVNQLSEFVRPKE